MEPKKYSSTIYNRVIKTFILVQIIQIFIQDVNSISFRGIPAAFGDLDLNKRTDIVVIGDDGSRVDIYYQHQRNQAQSPLELGFSCKSDRPVIQVYLADIDSDGNPNLLPLLLSDQNKPTQVYQLKSLKVKTLEQLNSPTFQTTKLTPNTAYSLATYAAALNSDGTTSTNNDSANSLGESLALSGEQRLNPPNCEFTDLGVEMTAQPLLFDLDGDLRTDFMSLNKEGFVTVWKPPKNNHSEQFEKMPAEDWIWIGKEYFAGPHSNAFIDINQDNAADIILSADGARIAYIYANPDPKLSFKNYSRQFLYMDDKDYKYGQSALVDINADGKIDHILPRCKKDKCEIIVLYENNHKEVIFSFTNQTDSSYDYNLEESVFATNYVFPITLRASDLDGDGYNDFVAVVKNKKDSKNKVVFLRNILDPNVNKGANSMFGAKTMPRTFEIHEIPPNYSSQNINLVTLFDINEDGKIDMLIGSSEQSNKPQDMNVSAIMNSQMVDACFMKVLVTNGYSLTDSGSNGQSARGPFICFELSQNDGKKMQGCAGQLSQASHFALQSPYVIFGLGQTPHFVETLNVSIPGYGSDRRVRTRLLEQIVPDAQVIIIPREKDSPSKWEYKMFLSPMSDLVFSTLIALAILCLLLLFIIFILHRQETLEDAAEHEEYKRHWPESR